MQIRPTTIDEMVGQSEVKQVIKTLVSAAKKTNTAVPSILFAGPSGTGKTTAAKALAKERGVVLHEVNAAILKNTNDLKNYLKLIKEKDILFIDEIHALNRKTTEFLYSVMEDYLYQDKISGQNKTVKLPKFTLVGASTETGNLLEPLRMRFKFVANFKEYTDDELCKIVHHVCQVYGFKLSNNIAKIIAKTCRGTPRIVVNRTEWIRSYFIANNLKSVSPQKVLEIIKLQGIDENGFNDTDRKYLKIVSDYGPISLNQIAQKLNIDKATVQKEIEPFLSKKNLINITTSGRVLCQN